MAITLPYKQPRGTRSALNALVASSGLITGQIYLLTDENRIAIATSANTYETFAKESEAGGGGGGITQAQVLTRNLGC